MIYMIEVDPTPRAVFRHWLGRVLGIKPHSARVMPTYRDEWP